MAPVMIPKWRVRDDDGINPSYPMGSSLFTIKYYHGGFFEWGKTRGNPVGYGDGLIGYVDNCDPNELTYLSIVGMAANFGLMDVRYLYFKRVGSEFATDIVRIGFDSDARSLGSFVDENKIVEVYCESHYNDEGEAISSSSDDSGNDEEFVTGESEDYSEFVDSDGEAIGKEGEVLVDTAVKYDLQAPKCAQLPNYRQAYESSSNVDVSILNEGFLDSDHFSEKGGSDTDEENFILKTPIFAKSDLANVEFKIGMRFGTCNEFKAAIREYSVQKGKNIKYKVQASRKMYLYCANTNEQGVKCKWRMYCAALPGEVTVQIKTFTDNHTCTRSYVISSVKPRYIAKKFLEMIRMNPKWGVKNFRLHVAKALEAEVTLSKAFRSLKVAKTILQGTSGQQYELLWDYCDELRRTNMGSTVNLRVKKGAGPNGESVFDSIYICWGALKRGFLEGCRPILGIDGTHLSGPHRGVLLTSVGLDANNCIYPLAYAVVGHETYKSWKWFLKLLLKDLNIERADEYTFISDKQKGLIKAMEKIVPGVEHRFCVWHLYNNFKLQHKGVALKNLLWKAARATTKPKFEEALEEMKAIDPDAYEWLASKPGQHWSKSHFSTHSKSDLLLNNICESFNGALKDARCKPILEMLEDIRLYLMEFVMQRKVAIEKVETMTKLCPIIAKKVEVREKFSHEWIVKFNGGTGFEVSGPYLQKFELDIHQRVCACRSWQLSGIPCSHAIAALNRMGYNIENYVHLCYSKDVYKKTYSNTLMPINGKELWSKSDKPKLLPPDVVVIVGRPRKGRRKGTGEKTKPHKLSKKGSVMTCGKCKKPGHNSKTCGRPEKPKKKPRMSEDTTSRLVDENESDFDDFVMEENDGTEQPPRAVNENTPPTDEFVMEENDGAEQPPRDVNENTPSRVVNENTPPRDDFDEYEREYERQWRELGGNGDDEHSDGVDEDEDLFNTQASGVTQASGNALVDVELQISPQRMHSNNKLQVRRRSSRLMFSPNKRSNEVHLVDLTEEAPSDGTMHAGIMKKPEKRPTNLRKGQIYKNGKVYASPAAFQVALEHERSARLKSGSK